MEPLLWHLVRRTTETQFIFSLFHLLLAGNLVNARLSAQPSRIYWYGHSGGARPGRMVNYKKGLNVDDDGTPIIDGLIVDDAGGGLWLPILMKIANEHKHEQLTPQIQKTYKTVVITATIPDGETVKIDFKQIPLKPTPDKPYHGTVGTWTGLVFATTGVRVKPQLEHSLRNVRRIVEDLSALCRNTTSGTEG